MLFPKGSIRGLGKSFVFAFKGLGYCIKNERNMRIHVVLAALVSLFCFFYKVTQMEFIAIFLCMGFVITSEMVNTAVETLVNLESPSYNNLAKIAKDVAAGAVFVSAVVSVAIAGAIFLQIDRLFPALTCIWESIWGAVTFLIIIVLGVLFIFRGPHIAGERNMRIYQIRTRKK